MQGAPKKLWLEDLRVSIFWGFSSLDAGGAKLWAHQHSEFTLA